MEWLFPLPCPLGATTEVPSRRHSPKQESCSRSSQQNRGHTQRPQPYIRQQRDAEENAQQLHASATKPTPPAKRENPLLTAGTARPQPAHTPLFLTPVPNDCDPDIYGGSASPSTTPKITRLPCSPHAAKPWPPMRYTALQQQGQDQRGTVTNPCKLLLFPFPALFPQYFQGGSPCQGIGWSAGTSCEGDAAVFGWHRPASS